MSAASPIHRSLRVAATLVTTGMASLAGAPIEAHATPGPPATSAVWRAPTAQEDPPVTRVTGGDALVKEKGSFRETWVHPDARLSRYSELYLWTAVFEFRPVRKRRNLGTTSSILRSTGREEYPVSQESRERFKQVFVDTLVGEVDVYLAKVGEGTVVFELIDPGTGLMQARVGERGNIRPPKRSDDVFSRPATVNTMWVDVERWARAVASDLRHELEKRLRRAENN